MGEKAAVQPAYAVGMEKDTEFRGGLVVAPPHGGGRGQVCLRDLLKRSFLGMGRVVVFQTCQDFPQPPVLVPISCERMGAS